ncbi:MAG TPA: four helix bundle protein [Chitinophagaceae bacterium]|nr:four helix bundle protein [Chitinophagaceae bacterium]
MKSYRELDIYNDSRKLAIEVHKMTLMLPKFELYEEGSQIRRSSKSVTAIIVEGYGRKRYKGEFIKYLVYSQAECDETIIHLDFLFETGSMTDKVKYDDLRKRINKFLKWVEDNWNEFPSPETGTQ